MSANKVTCQECISGDEAEFVLIQIKAPGSRILCSMCAYRFISKHQSDKTYQMLVDIEKDIKEAHHNT